MVHSSLYLAAPVYEPASELLWALRLKKQFSWSTDDRP
jgi:hypothetical protein